MREAFAAGHWIYAGENAGLRRMAHHPWKARGSQCGLSNLVLPCYGLRPALWGFAAISALWQGNRELRAQSYHAFRAYLATVSLDYLLGNGQA